MTEHQQDGSPGLTAKIGRTARFRGQAPPYDDPSSLPYRAWLVWSAAQLRAANVIQERDGVKGQVYTGPLATVIWELFPEQAGLPSDDRDAYQKEIRTYLRGSNNAVCTNSNPINPVWWIRSQWNDRINTSAPPRYVASSGERKLSPREAGEDREPGVVTVRHVERYDDPTSGILHGIDRRWFGELVRALRGSGNGIFARVIRDVATRRNTFTPFAIAVTINAESRTNIGNALNSLSDAGIARLVQRSTQSSSGVVEGRWEVIDESRQALTEIVKLADEDVEIAGYVPLDAESMCDVFPVDTWLNADEIARLVFAVRTRLYNALHRLERAELVVRRSNGKTSQWMRVSPASDEPTTTTTTVETTTTTVARSSEIRDPNVLAVADIVEQLVADRTAQVTVDLRRQRDELQRSYDELLRRYEAVVVERDSLQDALAPLRDLLKS